MLRFLLTLLLILPALVDAQPLRPNEVPPSLREWIPWVLHGQDTCPTMLGTDTRACVWPGKLELTLNATTGRFTQRVHASSAIWMPLPGDAKRWPQDVTVDGRAGVVLAQSGQPAVKLEAGDHVVSGTFAFESLPESMRIPAETGVLSLTVNGQPVAFPSRDASGLLWIQRSAAPEEKEARLDVNVHRLVTDEVPLLVLTRVRLDVSGASREVLLANTLLDGFVPMGLESPLPARVDADGRLRVQVRPGTWTIDVVARHERPTNALTLNEANGPWAAHEVWAFEARPDLRVVDPEGVLSVDPQQTTLPPQWRNLPAFRVDPGDTLKLVEQRRGDAEPAPDKLSLHRRMWLAFDGSLFTAQDSISGTLSRSWRLSMPEPSELGRVEVEGRDQIITRLAASDPPGVEVRNGALTLTAESQTPRKNSISAVSWNADFLSVAGSLMLPPGWRLLHASGVDSVQTSWFARWTLLDFFLLLITTVAAARLFGISSGALVFFAMLLSITEPGATRWFWLAAITTEALARVVKGRMGTVFRTARLGTWVLLALFLVPFASTQIRTGLYPSLENEYAGSFLDIPGTGLMFGASTAAMAGDTDRFAELIMPEMASSPSVRSMVTKKGLFDTGRSDDYEQKLDSVEVDPRSAAQTGPGVPEWSWRRVDLTWSGPVERHQQVSFVLVPPWANLVLSFLRTALLALFFALLIRRSRSPDEPEQISTAVPATVIAGLLLLLASPASAQTPSPEMLNELRTRLTVRPECHPNCASAPRMSAEIQGSALRLRMEVLVDAATAIPLPGDLEGWQPERVLLDEKPATALRRGADGALWLPVDAGAHRVIVEGALPARDTVQVPLPLLPRRVELAKLVGWEIAGVRDDGTAEGSLQITRKKRDGEALTTLDEGTMPAFFKVERALLLGLDWTIETQVTRLTSQTQPAMLEVPLVSGESVLSADVRVQSNRAMVHFPARVSQVTWRSSLARHPDIKLAAPKDVPWVEVWRLEATPVWHVEREGLPAVHAKAEVGARIPEWRPWPGETLTLNVTSPTPVPGPTLTIQSTRLDVTPGLRTTDATLTLSLSASRGGQHLITLPGDVEVQSLTIDNQAMPIRNEGGRVSFPVKPGKQEVKLEWRQPTGLTTSFRTPEIDLGLPSANASLSVKPPRDRWLLLVDGPRLGPAVLFWSLLLVILAIAAGLGRVKFTPLRTRHWLLLALGLTQVPVAAAGFVAGWLLLLGWRQERGAEVKSRALFNLSQLALVGVTVIALVILIVSIHEGLLGNPEMHVRGNNSSWYQLNWYQDLTEAKLPTAFVFSVPLLVYRGLMLVWALWLAFALVGWLRWGFAAYTTGGGWRSPVKAQPPPLPHSEPDA